MYKCNNCDRKFYEPKEERTTYEAYYGTPLGSSTPLLLTLCPKCSSEDFEECDEIE